MLQQNTEMQYGIKMLQAADRIKLHSPCGVKRARRACTVRAPTDGDTVMDGGWDRWIVLAGRREELLKRVRSHLM